MEMMKEESLSTYETRDECHSTTECNEAELIEAETAFNEKFYIPRTIGHYKIIEKVSPTTVGHVFKAVSVSNPEGESSYNGKCDQNSFKFDYNYVKCYALKVVLRKHLEDASTMLHFEQELRVMMFNLNHPSILKYYEPLFFKDFIVVVSEYCENGSLLDYFNNRNLIVLDQKIKIIIQVLEGIRYLHSKQISHRDIKLENIFIDSKRNAKIGDFGCCQISSTLESNNNNNKNRIYNNCGTLFYAPPELLKGEMKDPMKGDVWSFGIVVYILLMNKFPWKINYNEKVNECQNQGNEESKDEEMMAIYTNNIVANQICENKIDCNQIEFPSPLSSIVDMCTKINPEDRPTIYDVASLARQLIRFRPSFSSNNCHCIESDSSDDENNSYYSYYWEGKSRKDHILDFLNSGSSSILDRSRANARQPKQNCINNYFYYKNRKSMKYHTKDIYSRKQLIRQQQQISKFQSGKKVLIVKEQLQKITESRKSSLDSFSSLAQLRRGIVSKA